MQLCLGGAALDGGPSIDHPGAYGCTITGKLLGDHYVTFNVTDPSGDGSWIASWKIPRAVIWDSSFHYRELLERTPTPQEIGLSHRSPRAANTVLEILSGKRVYNEEAPYLGLMVEIARFGKEYDFFDVLQPWFPYWLGKHHQSDRDGRGGKFDCSDIGHYLCLAGSLDDLEHTRNAETLARVRLAPGFHRDWRKDEILSHEEGLIGKFRLSGFPWA